MSPNTSGNGRHVVAVLLILLVASLAMPGTTQAEAPAEGTVGVIMGPPSPAPASAWASIATSDQAASDQAAFDQAASDRATSDRAANQPTHDELAIRERQPTDPTGPSQPNILVDDVTFTLRDVLSLFGPETYKETDRLNTRNGEDLSNQTTTWTTSLGHSISFLVRVGPKAGQTLDCAQRFNAVAYIETGSGRLYGWTNGTVDAAGSISCQDLAGVRTFNVTFDLDGAPSLQTGSYPQILGSQLATLELYYADRPTPGNPSGQGGLAGTYQIPFTVLPVGIQLDKTLYRMPDAILRGFTDAGGGVRFLMPITPYAVADTIPITLNMPGARVGAPFVAEAWYPTRVAGGGLDTPTGLPGPLGPVAPATDKVTDLDERSVILQRVTLDVGRETIPAGNRVGPHNFTGSQFRPAGSDNVPFYVASLHVPAQMDANGTDIVTGATSIGLPINTADFPVRGVTLAGIGQDQPTVTTQVTFTDQDQVSGGPPGANAGDLVALRPTGFSFDILGRDQMERDSGATLVTGEIGHTSFYTIQEGAYVLDELPLYRLTGMFYDENDGFLGMQSLQRGIELGATPVRVVEQTSSNLTLRIASLSTDFDTEPGENAFIMTVRLAASGIPGLSDYNQTITLGEGQSAVIPLPLRSETSGQFTARITATSGEILRTLNVPITVISQEEFDAANKKWYDIPGPEVGPIVLAFVGLVLLASRRRGL